MNNNLSRQYFMLVMATFLFSCMGTIKKENKNTLSTSSVTPIIESEKDAQVNTKESVVEWKGSNTFGPHTGFVYISKGVLKIENGELSGGNLVVDMNTIEDESHQSDNNLIKHLKDPDFFDVQKFPTASITLTNVSTINGVNKEFRGNLTIKGITHSVSFPAKVSMKDSLMTANGKLVIDRTKWDVRYNSGKFFDNLKDQAISDSIEFNFKIVAKNNG